MSIFLPYYILINAIVIVVTTNKVKPSKYVRILFSIIVLSFYTLVIGTRDFNHPGDTDKYLYIFQLVLTQGFLESILELRVEKGFVFLVHLISMVTDSPRTFLLLVSSAQSILWLFFLNLWSKKYKLDLLVCCSLLISMFFFYNLGANVIRQGFAIPLSFIGLFYFFSSRNVLGTLFFILAFSFHSSSLILLVAYLLTIKKVKYEYYLILLLIISALSIFGIFSTFLEVFTNTISMYAHLVRDSSLESYKTGFRLDFWLFSMVPVFLFLISKKQWDDKYKKIFKLYILVFMFFIFMFEIPYSDRIGLYLWCMFPILLPMFVGGFKYRFFGSKLFFLIVIFFTGFTSFVFHPLMNFNMHVVDVI
jgi:hypothetical protein